MQLYPKTSPELVLDLIAATNPGLPFPLTVDTVYIGPPTAIAVVPPAIVNTTARISSKPSSKYTGSKVVSYQRINLANLFFNVTPNIRKYSATGEAGGNPFTIYQLLPFLNDLYGVKLTQDDVNDAAFPAYSTITEGGVSKKVASVAMTAKATSQAFIGSVLIRTQAGQRDLSSIILKTEIPGRLYPGGNDFVTNTKDRLDCIGYGIDFSELMNGLGTSQTNPRSYFFAAGLTIGWSSNAVGSQQDVFDAIKTVLGIPLVVGYGGSPPASARWCLNAATTNVVTLPNAAYPEANSKDFNRLAVVTPVAGNTWATGRLYLHYNV